MIAKDVLDREERDRKTFSLAKLVFGVGVGYSIVLNYLKNNCNTFFTHEMSHLAPKQCFPVSLKRCGLMINDHF